MPTGARTELFGRNQPGGLYALIREDICSGAVFWVNSVTGANSAGAGRNPLKPFASLDFAMSKVTSGAGDHIYLMPGHVETLTAAGSSLGNGGVFVGATLSNNVKIIGLGVGRYRPTFNYTTAAGASMNVLAAGVLIRNCVFTPTGVSAVTAAINVTGVDFTMDNCEWQISTGGNAPVLGILTAATAARLVVTNTRFLGPFISTQTCTAAIKHEVGIDFVIRNCEFFGKLTSGILNATAVLGGLIDNCHFDVSGVSGIIAHNSSTMTARNNTFVIASSTNPITGTLVNAIGNKYTTQGVGVNAGAALTF